MRLLPVLNSLWRVPIIILMTIGLATISVFFSLFDSSGKLQHKCARTWGSWILWISRVRVLTSGMDRLDRQRGYIFMPNHLSMFDHWALLPDCRCSSGSLPKPRCSRFRFWAGT